jgi:hypothetical protein
MAGAAARLQQQAQVNNMNMAIQVINTLDQALDAEKLRAINTLKEIAADPSRLLQLKISDSDYELMPKPPEIVRSNGTKAKAETVEVGN